VVVSSASVVVPVKNGERYLAELLEALRREAPDEILVIDSGSSDRSLEITRAAQGVRLLEIDPAQFGHGRTRNLGVEHTHGELVCFLTQDATPCPGWLSAYRSAFALDERVGAAYGPHLPRDETSPMIARELTEFFATFSPGGEAVVQRAGDPAFLSNVNACCSRACWEQIRFRDIAYAEDQAFGRDLLAAGWTKVYAPAAAVLHAHDYAPLEFMRRYFDEYRGLRESTGHIEGFALRGALDQVAADRRWMRENGYAPVQRARWSARSLLHHTGRRVAAPLGSRAERLPAAAQRRLSLERRDGAAAPAATAATAEAATGALAPGSHIVPWGWRYEYEAADIVRRSGATPLLDPVPGMSEREQLRIAMLLPHFRRGSGGHMILMQILLRLERRGHVCTVYVQNTMNMHESDWPGVLRFNLREFFAPISAPVFKDFGQWQGADVVIATGWQTVHPALLLDQTRARVYIVNDHEPQFYPTSIESELARDTYRHGLHCIASSPWLCGLLEQQYGASTDLFEFGVEHESYRPRPVARRTDTIVYYSRQSTPRRAVPIALAALAELHRRRPELRIVLFGDPTPPRTGFPYEHHKVLSPEQLSWLYSEATVGLCLSLTNFSLMPKEMLACGLPCVELAGVSAESIFGSDGPIELAELNPFALADAIERLLDDPDLRERRSREGIEFVASHTWEAAADAVERGLRHALRRREQSLEAA
jgi:GT2 family glycosyltransferase/glycosyltransferase involved in cell wall biosynthesis